MTTDSLQHFNKNLAGSIRIKTDEELWEFLIENESLIKNFFDTKKHPRTSGLFAYPHGMKRFEEYFKQRLEDYREGVIYTLILDFCFPGEEVDLDYWGAGGYLDSGDSCEVETSEEVMPTIDEESDEGYKQKYFHLLEPHHLENIIRAMEKNIDKLSVNTSEDVSKIKAMKEFCLKNDGYKTAYIYNNY